MTCCVSGDAGMLKIQYHIELDATETITRARFSPSAADARLKNRRDPPALRSWAAAATRSCSSAKIPERRKFTGTSLAPKEKRSTG
jgi:hypothetical protein